jgi:cytochrome b subunit of formate dehydrogenase
MKIFWIESYKLKKVTHWLLLVLTVVYIVSGLGITYYRNVEGVTFGLLSKALSFKIHSFLLIPFLILLILHIVIVLRIGRKKSSH